MTRLVAGADVDEEALARITARRDGIVLERPDCDGAYIAVDGPVDDYRRTLQVDSLGGGRWHVTQTVEYRLAIPYFRPLFALPIRAQLGRIHPPADGKRLPWWHPPDRLDRRAAGVLATLALLSIVVGYFGSLLSQTITYAASEFGATRRAQGIALASVRADVVISLVLVTLADRRGRKSLLIVSAAAGAVLTALAALAPTLPLLAASQVVARGCVTAAAVLIAIVMAEEMPANGRAYAVSLLAMAAALGSGISVMALPLADLGPRAWRLVFAAALLGLPVIVSVHRQLPESRRFTAHQPPGETGTRSRRGRVRGENTSGQRGRLVLLSVSALLLALFLAPAAQFQNEFLRTERHFSASRISIFTLATNTPGGIGVVVGGRLADVRGRRLVGSMSIVLGVGATALMYFSHGVGLWGWSVFGAITGAAVIPALGVYGPELFPTGVRGRANGWITATGRVGSILGLVIAGFLSSAHSFGRLAPALALLGLGPLALAVLVLVAYPETAHLELEDLNPEDRSPSHPAPLGEH